MHVGIDERAGMHIIDGLAEISSDVVLGEILLNLLIAAEHTETLQTPYAAVHTLALDHTVIFGRSGERTLQNLVVVPAGAELGPVLPILANLVAPAQVQLPAPVVYGAVVLRRSLRAYGGGEERCAGVGHEHIAAAVVVVVKVDRETTVEETHIETDVGLVVLVPVYAGIDATHRHDRTGRDGGVSR